ncbi:MAG: dipicolinate synthase subunit DpsA [Clostridia bacterium]|nr:dipicolinate synthase subunit DpsA [Clostridia bacterium]
MKKIAVIGGDLRIVKLVEMFAKDGYEISTYGLEKAESITNIKNVKQCSDIQEAVKDTQIVIGPIPLSSNNVQINTPFSEKTVTLEEIANIIEGKTFIAGNIKKELYDLTEGKNVEIIDLLDREELVVLNTISTAEGAIQIAMEETTRTIHGSNILVLGYGRVGKILANMLKGIGANVYCEARKNVDLAWIKAYGYEPIRLNELDEKLNKFNIIINTIPSMILDEEKIKLLNEDCLIVDLASNPGGVDRTAAKKYGIKTIWALSLPGKVAPLTSAEFIKDTIYNIFKEM